MPVILNDIDNTMNDLMREVAVAIDSLDAEYITELKAQLTELKSVFPDNKDIITMEAWIEDAEQAINRFDEYEQIKQNMMPELTTYCNGDKQEAEWIIKDSIYNYIYDTK